MEGAFQLVLRQHLRSSDGGRSPDRVLGATAYLIGLQWLAICYRDFGQGCFRQHGLTTDCSLAGF